MENRKKIKGKETLNIVMGKDNQLKEMQKK